MTTPTSLPNAAAIREAHARIKNYIHRTPVLTSRTLNELTGASVYLKAENLQKIGAFKARGAHNAVFSLSGTEAARGVVTHSSGNHAAALALAASNRGIPAYIVMPSNAAKTKVASVRRLGAEITFCEPTLAARETTAAAVRQRTGAAFVHPYDDDRVIAGQGTAVLELLEDVPDLQAVVVPVGGGGLLSGTALYAKETRPGIRVYAAEPLMADDASRSFQARRLIPQTAPRTIADGLLTSMSARTFAVMRDHVDDVATVDEAAIVEAMRFVWEILKTIVEPSAAVAVAALLRRKLPVDGQRVGVILSGGNVDLDRLPWERPA
ncbi:MAG: pyridoxal-5-phosphate-dependent protein subunit beta [Verrucomicrobia bacterium]|nr:pyridoxal-5-phosphate-dependent protein subunit beta [Verrucomicrobiota bacterium]